MKKSLEMKKSEEQRVVIIGSGHAGVQLAISLRHEKFCGPIALINGESHPPYQRPPLSKDFLAHGNRELLHFRSASFFEQHRIELISGRVDRIERNQATAYTHSGIKLEYDHLVLATGSSARRLQIESCSPGRIHQLNDVESAIKLKSCLEQSASIMVVGAGFIGLEFAAFARSAGKTVHVVDISDRVLSRSVSVETSYWFLRALTAAGIQLHLGCSISSVTEGHENVKVHFSDGTCASVDQILIGVGSQPNTGLAEEAGLAINGGIIVDQYLSSSDKSVSAIGDCVVFPSPHVGGTLIRLESVQNAVDQAKCLAARLVGGKKPYDNLPWFWSNIGSQRLQIAGMALISDDAVARPTCNGHSVYRFRDGWLRAVETINLPAVHIAARRILSSGRPVSKEELDRVEYELARIG